MTVGRTRNLEVRVGRWHWFWLRFRRLEMQLFSPISLGLTLIFIPLAFYIIDNLLPIGRVANF